MDDMRPTCIEDCAHCDVPDPHDGRFRFAYVGYCKENGFFVAEDDGPMRLGCEDFAWDR